jgi:hypothetical protein
VGFCYIFAVREQLALNSFQRSSAFLANTCPINQRPCDQDGINQRPCDRDGLPVAFLAPELDELLFESQLGGIPVLTTLLDHGRCVGAMTEKPSTN